MERPYALTVAPLRGEPSRCPVCLARISGLVRARRWIDFDCEDCGEVRLETGRDVDGDFAEHLRIALDDLRPPHVPDCSFVGTSWMRALEVNAGRARSFRDRMSEAIVRCRAAHGGSGRVVIAAFFFRGAFGSPPGPSITAYDLLRS